MDNYCKMYHIDVIYDILVIKKLKIKGRWDFINSVQSICQITYLNNIWVNFFTNQIQNNSSLNDPLILKVNIKQDAYEKKNYQHYDHSAWHNPIDQFTCI